MSMINFILSWVGHEKSFKRPDLGPSCLQTSHRGGGGGGGGEEGTDMFIHTYAQAIFLGSKFWISICFIYLFYYYYYYYFFFLGGGGGVRKMNILLGMKIL